MDKLHFAGTYAAGDVTPTQIDAGALRFKSLRIAERTWSA